MKQDELPPFEHLDAKIEEFRRKTAPRAEPKPQGAGLAMRMGLELVAGVGVGAAAGILLDRWLGTSPFLLLTCFFLGAAGGGLNLYRVAQSQSMDEDGKQKKESELEKND